MINGTFVFTTLIVNGIGVVVSAHITQVQAEYLILVYQMLISVVGHPQY